MATYLITIMVPQVIATEARSPDEAKLRVASLVTAAKGRVVSVEEHGVDHPPAYHNVVEFKR